MHQLVNFDNWEQYGENDEQYVPPTRSAASAPSADGEVHVTDAMLEAETAITQVMTGERSAVELAPRGSYVLRLQHQMAERYNVHSERRGREPNRRVKIFRG